MSRQFALLRCSITDSSGADTRSDPQWIHHSDSEMLLKFYSPHMLGIETRMRGCLSRIDLSNYRWKLYHKNQNLLFVPEFGERIQLKFQFQRDIESAVQLMLSENSQTIQFHQPQQQSKSFISQSQTIHSPHLFNTVSNNPNITSNITSNNFALQHSPPMPFSSQAPRPSNVRVPINYSQQPVAQSPALIPQSHLEPQMKQPLYQKVHTGNLQSLIDVTGQILPQEYAPVETQQAPESNNSDNNKNEDDVLNEEIDDCNDDELKREILRIISDPQFPEFLTKVHGLLLGNK